MPSHITDGPRGRRFLYELLATCGERGAFVRDAVMQRSYSDEGMSPADIAHLIRSVPRDPSPQQVSEALGEAVGWAMYWQEPGNVDNVLAEPEIHAAFAELDEERILSLLANLGVDEGVGDEPGMVSVSWVGVKRPPGTAEELLTIWYHNVVKAVERAKTQRPDDPAAPWSGMWFSMPVHGLTTSNGLTPSGEPAGLSYVEDGPPRDDADVSVITSDPERLYIIDSADDWADLCLDYPLDVTAEVRQDWYRSTGRDGKWIIPNWLEVSRDWETVLLTRKAYLSSAGTIIYAGDAASVIAGWNPGEMYWLKDVTKRTEPVRWHMDDDLIWSPSS